MASAGKVDIRSTLALAPVGSDHSRGGGLWESEGLEAAMTTWSEQLRAEGRVEGIVGMLVRMARHRFGEATASTTAALLLGSVTSEAALEEIGACLLTCENGDALIAKIRQI